MTKWGGAEEEACPPSLMTMPVLRVRQPSGVSAGSALTPNSAGDPEECEEEREKEEEEDAVLLGI